MKSIISLQSDIYIFRLRINLYKDILKGQLELYKYDSKPKQIIALRNLINENLLNAKESLETIIKDYKKDLANLNEKLEKYFQNANFINENYTENINTCSKLLKKILICEFDFIKHMFYHKNIQFLLNFLKEKEEEQFLLLFK